MQVAETERLRIRHLTTDDNQFILALLNEPCFLKNIGDRKVRTTEDASTYLLNGPIASYQKFGFGLFLVSLKNGEIPIGICGLLKRHALENVDIGFAFLEQHWAQGYACESAAAILRYGRDTLRLTRIVAITKPDNQGSIRTLEKLGLHFEKTIQLPFSEDPSNLFAIDFNA